MLGLWANHAKTFLLVLASGTAIAFAIPIAVAPLRWARLFLWKIPEDTNLAVYFGRCLGAFAIILDLLMFRAALTSTGVNLVFELMLMVWIFMVMVHIVGAIQRIQPISETLEIGFWIMLTLLTVAFWPGDSIT
jgi:hypothetical protein